VEGLPPNELSSREIVRELEPKYTNDTSVATLEGPVAERVVG
jgi:hypothetical protein